MNSWSGDLSEVETSQYSGNMKSPTSTIAIAVRCHFGRSDLTLRRGAGSGALAHVGLDER